MSSPEFETVDTKNFAVVHVSALSVFAHQREHLDRTKVPISHQIHLIYKEITAKVCGGVGGKSMGESLLAHPQWVSCILPAHDLNMRLSYHAL